MPKPIESQAKASLDNSIEQLDEGIESKLAQIRQNALKTKPKQAVITWLTFERKGLVSAFSVVMVAFLLSVGYLDTQDNTEASSAGASLVVLTEVTTNELSEDPELLDELEFIYWLSQEHEDV